MAEEIPSLVVWGTRDRMIPSRHASTAQQEITGCRVELFDGAGHFPHLDEPERFAELLRDFMADSDFPADSLQSVPAA